MRRKSKFIELYRATEVDAVQITDLLRQEGIPTRLFGVDNPANFGVTHFEDPSWRIEVHQDFYLEAGEILQDFLAEVPSTDPAELPWELRNENCDEQTSTSPQDSYSRPIPSPEPQGPYRKFVDSLQVEPDSTSKRDRTTSWLERLFRIGRDS